MYVKTALSNGGFMGKDGERGSKKYYILSYLQPGLNVNIFMLSYDRLVYQTVPTLAASW